ncbi:MAG: hypothetical protein KAU21_13735, partial [Gammaproteobacteria bacterium]|nr:hypothetical protein [Gammaproteobacteria bacterium]
MATKKKTPTTLQLMKLYSKANPNHQRLLQLMALIHHPVASPKLYACVHQLDIKDSDNHKFTHKKLLQTLELLNAEGFLKRTGNQFYIVETIAEKLCRELQSSGQFQRFSTTADKFIEIGKSWDSNYLLSAKQGHRLIRSAIYAHQVEKINRWSNVYYQYFQAEYDAHNPILSICLEPFDSDWLYGLPGDVLSVLMHEALTASSLTFSNISRLIDWVREAFQTGHLTRAEQLAFMCAGHFILNGELEKAQSFLPHTDDYHQHLITAWRQFLLGDNELAIKNFEQAIVQVKKMTGKRKVFINNISGVFFILALIKSDDPDRLQQAIDYSTFHQKQKQHANAQSHRVLANLLSFIQTNHVPDYQNTQVHNWQDYRSTLAFILHCYYLYWSDKDQAVKQITQLKKYAKAAENGDNHWLVAEACQLLSVLEDKGQISKKKADALFLQQQTQSLMSVVRYKEKW